MKLFKSLLVAPAALGLLSPLAANASEVNLNDVSNYSTEFEMDSSTFDNSSSTSKSITFSWITASSSYDLLDKIDDYFQAYGANISRRGSGTVVRKAQSASFVQEYPIFLADRQPLHDWKIEIRRLTPDNSAHWNPVEIDGMGAQLFASCNISTVEAQITDKFSYPTSAIAAVSYAAEDFSSPPKRSYRIQGRKVKVTGFKKAIITLKKGQSIDLTTEFKLCH